MRDERFDLHGEVEQPAFAVWQDLRVGLGLVEGHGRLIDELEPAQIFDIHIALAAGHEQAHRIAVAGHDALAVLVERDHDVIQRKLHRHAAR